MREKIQKPNGCYCLIPKLACDIDLEMKVRINAGNNNNNLLIPQNYYLNIFLPKKNDSLCDLKKQIMSESFSFSLTLFFFYCNLPLQEPNTQH